MLLLETTIFYLLVGAGVAVAVYLRSQNPAGIGTICQSMGACLFWPLFVPALLARADGLAPIPVPAAEGDASQPDTLAAAISQVECELEAALQNLDGWAENVLSSEQRRLEELQAAWKLQADRIRQIDRLLGDQAAQADTSVEATGGNQRARQSEAARRENMRQLAALRNQLHGDLVGTLAWVRELVTMIHLAKFSGAPAARAEELVAQIAAAVEGLSEVSAWRDHDQPRPAENRRLQRSPATNGGLSRQSSARNRRDQIIGSELRADRTENERQK